MGEGSDVGALDSVDPFADFKFHVEADPVVAKARSLKMDFGSPLKERSVVDRMGAIADGEPDPGPDLPDPVADLRRLWGTDPTEGLINALIDEMGESLDG